MTGETKAVRASGWELVKALFALVFVIFGALSASDGDFARGAYFIALAVLLKH